MRVVEYINTRGDERFKSFLNQPFSINMLYSNSEIKNSETYFSNWRGKNMGSWQRYTNEKDIVLEFYPNYYNVQISKNKIIQNINLPKTINDFINEMIKMDVDLYWSEWIDINFEPKQYLHENEIKKYYENLLASMDKSHELL